MTIAVNRRLRARAEWNRKGRPWTAEFDGRRIWQHVTIDGPRGPWATALLDAAAREPMRTVDRILRQLNSDYAEYLPPGSWLSFDTSPIQRERR